MSATIGAAAITAGAGLLGSLFGANKQDKNAQAQRDCSSSNSSRHIQQI